MAVLVFGEMCAAAGEGGAALMEAVGVVDAGAAGLEDGAVSYTR